MKAWTVGVRRQQRNQALALTNQPRLRWRLAVYLAAIPIGAAIGVALAILIGG